MPRREVILSCEKVKKEQNRSPGEARIKTNKRYWISLKKRYADRHVGNKANKTILKSISVEDDFFKGDIYFYNFIDVKDKILIPNGKCIMDNNYKWLEFYNYNSKIKLTAIYNENNEIIEFNVSFKMNQPNHDNSDIKNIQLADTNQITGNESIQSKASSFFSNMLKNYYFLIVTD